MNDDFRRLRTQFDGNDPFMSGGHQIKKIRARERAVPDWAADNTKVRSLLLRSFPKLKINVRERERAARWAAVITMFYRMKMSKSRIAAELKIATTTVKLILQHIQRAAAGKRADSTGLLGARPTGRPRKKAMIPSKQPV
jgi:hypothetical protein